MAEAARAAEVTPKITERGVENLVEGQVAVGEVTGAAVTTIPPPTGAALGAPPKAKRDLNPRKGTLAHLHRMGQIRIPSTWIWRRHPSNVTR